MNANQCLPTWLALGDSYTIGEGVSSEDRWPAQLARKQHFALPQYLAKTGWTTVDLLEAIKLADLAPQYDWVSVMIGVNDQYDGLSIEWFQQGLTQIIDFAIDKAAYRRQVVVFTIPDYSVTPFVEDHDPESIRSAVDSFNVVISDAARAKEVLYCDITPSSRKAANDAELLVADGLHPSGTMYRMWAEKIASDIIAPDYKSAK